MTTAAIRIRIMHLAKLQGELDRRIKARPHDQSLHIGKEVIIEEMTNLGRKLKEDWR